MSFVDGWVVDCGLSVRLWAVSKARRSERGCEGVTRWIGFGFAGGVVRGDGCAESVV